jgi:GntR family transcriptional regulator
MQVIDPTSPVRKHFQLREILLDMLEGDFAVDDAIPSERELCARFGLARMTVRKAVDHLVLEGRLYRVPGKGTFVARPKIALRLQLASFSADMRARGLEPGSVDLGRRVTPAGRRVARELGLADDEPVHVIERLRTADGLPMGIERNHFPAALTPGLIDEPLDGKSLFAVLEDRYGIVFDEGEQIIEAGVADGTDARLLGLSEGSAVLLHQRRARASGRPVEYAVSTYRADRYQLTAALELPPRNIVSPMEDAVPAGAGRVSSGSEPGHGVPDDVLADLVRAQRVPPRQDSSLPNR